MENNIKKTAKNFFSKKDYSSALRCSFDSGVLPFISFVKKEHWFNEPGFVKSFSSDTQIFSAVLKSEIADEFLHDYFIFSEFIPEFELKLAKDFPELFVHVVRVNQSFLDSNRLKLYSSINLPNNLNVHVSAWQHIKLIEEKLWKEVVINLQSLYDSKYCLEELLGCSIIWFEEKRFSRNDTKLTSHLASVYNIFIQLILHNYLNSKSLVIDSKEMFVELFLRNIKIPLHPHLEKVLDNLSQWVHFRDSILYPYCFDLNISLSKENEVIHFNRDPKYYYKWELDGTRYSLNRFEYSLKGAEIVDYLLDAKEIIIPTGDQNENCDGNYQIAVQQWQLASFMQDFSIESFILNGRKVNLQPLVLPLITYTKNRFIRYEQGLDYPFFLMTKDEYVKLNNSALEELPQNSSIDLINLFSYSPGSPKDFNKFNLDYNVWQKPFVQLGNYLFCPMMFFANNDWFYGFAQAALTNLNTKYAFQERKETATKMEQELGRAFENKKWDVKIVDDKTANKIDGDVDVVVRDKEICLLIQLKRTKFRLDLKEAYFESINTDRKASQQLNDAEKFLSKENDIHSIEGVPKKWIVTTSFENILTEMDGCLKVNYFDVLRALENPKLKKLSEFINYINCDGGIRDFLEKLNDPSTPELIKLGIVEAGLPIQLAIPNKYKQALFPDDDRFFDYHRLYGKAIELNQKGNNKKAINLLKKCIEISSNDYEVWSALGNIYADIKDFNNSYDCFKKALQVMPDDPFIQKEYLIALREGGNIEESLKILRKIYEKYWYIMLN